MVGSNPATSNTGTTYVDAGVTATDNLDTGITGRVQVTSNVNNSARGTYAVTYTLSDIAGNVAAAVTRTVNVKIMFDYIVVGGGGGGGEASGYGGSRGGSGGSGVVIIRYPGTVAKATGGTITYVNGYVYHRFTGAGTFTVNASI